MTETAERLADPGTPDATVAALARVADAEALGQLLQDQARLVRHPAIVAAIFENPRAPMALVNRAIAICAAAGVKVEEIPSFDELAQAIAGDPGATEAETADPSFEGALQAATEASDGADDPAQPEKKRKSAVIDFGKLKLYEKIRLATLGNATCRQTLLRDSNKLVAMAAIRSPGITDAEVVRASANRAVSEDVIRYIANKREYLKHYVVKLNLVQNPKCPLPTSLKLMAHLHADDLKALSRSRNIPNALSTAAKRLALARGAK
jgi:hypothetical protein